MRHEARREASAPARAMEADAPPKGYEVAEAHQWCAWRGWSGQRDGRAKHGRLAQITPLLRQKILHAQAIARQAEAKNTAPRYGRNVRNVPKRLARLRVADVNLQNGATNGRNTVAQSDRSMRVRARIEQNALDRKADFL